MKKIKEFLTEDIFRTLFLGLLIAFVLFVHFCYYIRIDPLEREVRKTNEVFAKTLSETVFDDVGGEYPIQLKIGYYDTYDYEYCIVRKSDYEPIYTVYGSQADFNQLIFELEEVKKTYAHYDNEAYLIWVNVQYNPKEKEYGPIDQFMRLMGQQEEILSGS